MTIREIMKKPTIVDNVHESIYRSYDLLEKVKTMLIRGDNQKTILEIIEHIESVGRTKTTWEELTSKIL
jgi:hypothetical protein